MTNTAVTKVETEHKAPGHGQVCLATGKSMSMRLWKNEPAGEIKEPTQRDYETIGYVISGRAELVSEGQTISLEPGNSWVVPKGASHQYKIMEEFTAIEATSPPSETSCSDR